MSSPIHAIIMHCLNKSSFPMQTVTFLYMKHTLYEQEKFTKCQ